MVLLRQYYWNNIVGASMISMQRTVVTVVMQSTAKATSVKQNSLVANTSSAGQVISTGNYTSVGGTLNIAGRLGGYVSTNSSLSFVLKVDGNIVYTFNEFFAAGQNMSLPFNAVVGGIPAGTHTLQLVNNGGAFNTEAYNYVDLVVIEV